MMEELERLLRQGALVAVLGGIVAYLLAYIIGPIQGMAWGGTLVSLLALILVLYLMSKTDVEQLDLFHFAVLLLVVGIIGSVITGILPMASPFILSMTGALTIQSIVWALVYIGAAMWIEKSTFKGS